MFKSHRVPSCCLILAFKSPKREEPHWAQITTPLRSLVTHCTGHLSLACESLRCPSSEIAARMRAAMDRGRLFHASLPHAFFFFQKKKKT